jgi:hypothetical protein
LVLVIFFESGFDILGRFGAVIPAAVRLDTEGYDAGQLLLSLLF